jgi:uncharacterized membrane protein
MFSLFFFRRLHEETFSTQGANRDVIDYIGKIFSHPNLLSSFVIHLLAFIELSLSIHLIYFLDFN